MTGWIEYFVEGLSTQLAEVRQRGEWAIQRDILCRQHELSDRQGRVLGYVMEHGALTIQACEALCPDINRRSLQRDLKGMLDKGVLVTQGATNRLEYRLGG